MAINFPIPTQVGEVFTDTSSGNTYTCSSLGPPAEWTSTTNNADLNQTYLRLDASNGPVSGDLGIGGTFASPNIALNADGLVNTTNAFTVNHPAGTGSEVASFVNYNGGSPGNYAVYANGDVKIGGDASTAPNIELKADGTASFAAGNGVAIDANGRLIVGAANASGYASSGLLVQANGNDSTGSGNLVLKAGTATTSLGADAEIGTIKFGDLTGLPYAGIVGQADGTPSSGNSPGSLIFSTVPSGTQVTQNRMMIRESGNVLIGGTLPGTPNISLNADGSGVFESFLGCKAPNATPGAVAQIWRESAGGTELARLTGDAAFRLGNTSTTYRIALYGGSGDAAFTGSVSKGSGSFNIPHPLPALKDTHRLVHSFIEGPQADNIYRGQVTLEDGVALVDLDVAARMTEGTFVLLNTNISCFTSNETDWVHVRGSVSGSTLTIEAQDNTSTATVSWMVVGERHDQHMLDTEWTDENGRVITEPTKGA